MATTGVAVSAPPRRCRATGQKCPPAPTSTGASMAIVHDPACPRPGGSTRPGAAIDDLGTGATQQEVVELAAANRVADRARIARFDRAAANHPGAKAGDLLQGRAGRAVLRRIEVEQGEDVRRQPSRADLVARKPRAIDDDDLPSCEPQLARARRAGGPAADDDRVAADHGRVMASFGRLIDGRRGSAAGAGIRSARRPPGTAASSRCGRRLGAGEIQLPGAVELFAVHRAHAVGGGRKAVRSTAPACARSAAAGSPRRPPTCRPARGSRVVDLRERRRVGARKDPPANPGVQGPGHVASDEMQQAAAAVALHGPSE